MNEQAWKDLEQDKEHRLPTPPIGHPVQWYQAGNKASIYAGVVTGIEGPGRLKIQVAVINTFPAHKAGCYHVNHAIHDKPNATTQSGGSWDYLPYTEVPKEHYALHDAELEKRELNLIQMDENQKRAAEAFERKREERVSNKGRIKSPAPLPAPA